MENTYILENDFINIACLILFAISFFGIFILLFIDVIIMKLPERIIAKFYNRKFNQRIYLMERGIKNLEILCGMNKQQVLMLLKRLQDEEKNDTFKGMDKDS